MSQSSLVAIIGTIGALLGAVSAVWVAFVAARRLGLDRQNSYLASVTQGIAALKAIIDELQDQIERQRNEIDLLRQKVRRMERRLKELGEQDV